MSEISNKRSEDMRTGSLDEAANLLRELAGERRADENIKAVLRRVARQLKGWSYSRVRTVWYRDPRVQIRGGEIEQLRALARPAADEGTSAHEIAELRATVARLAKYEVLLERLGAEFSGPQLSASGNQAGEASGLLGTRGVRR